MLGLILTHLRVRLPDPCFSRRWWRLGVCFGIFSVNRTGLALQEIVRVALNELEDILTKTVSSYRLYSNIPYRPSKIIVQYVTSSTSRHLCYGSTLVLSVVTEGRWRLQKAVSRALSRYSIHLSIATRS
jgi:hypothetical protein